MERDGQDGYFSLPDFKNKITAVYQLDDAKRTPLEVKVAADGRRFINPPRWINDSLGTVFVVEIEGDKVTR